MNKSTTIDGTVRQWKRYEQRQATGISWLGDIPHHWHTRRLKHICKMNPSKSEIKGLPDDLHVSFLPMEKVSERGELDLELRRPIGVVWQGFTYFRDGDVLVAKITPCFENGKGALAKGLENGIGFGTTELHVLRPKPMIDPRYLELITRQHAFRNLGCMSMTGVAGQQRVSEAFICNFVVGIPPLDEQHRIVEFLDREAAKIDDLIAKKQKLIELLHEKRTALISHAVTKGLDASVPMKDSGVEWVQAIPAHWDVLRNGFLFFDRDQRGYPDLPILEISIHTGVKVREFSSEHVEQKAEDHGTYKRSLAGDLAFNKMRMWQGAVGVTPEDGLVSPDYQVCRPRPGVHSRYFEQLFRTSFYLTEINRYSHGIVKDRNRLYWDQFKEMLSLVPPPDEQLRIIEHVHAITKRTGRMIQKVQSAIDKLREYSTALVSAAVTGKIDVREEVAPA
jgi:type I restriction enzyme S subunit